MLAQAYDALKAVDSTITVIGVSLAPGNDNPLAAVNASTSPVRCIRELGIAYRASGRKKPIMDELAFHPHPNSYADNFLVGYRWPNAGTSNLGRIKQAVWDAFSEDRTADLRRGRQARLQGGVAAAPRPAERGRLAGAVPPSSMHAYYGRESVARLADERFQADNYAALIPYFACDASIRSMLYYGLVDEPDLDRWQAGLIRADGSRRPSFGVVRSALSRGLARCSRRPTRWRHTTKVVGATARFGERRRSASETTWAFGAASEEASTFRAAMYRLKRRASRPPSGSSFRPRSGEAVAEAGVLGPRQGPRARRIVHPLPEKAPRERLLRLRDQADCGDEPRQADGTRLQAVRRRPSQEGR